MKCCLQSQLPEHAIPHEEAQLYWIETASHRYFSNNQTRNIFVACVESVIKEHDNMCLLKIKEFWNKTDDDLVMNNRFTKQGLLTYWEAMDASFKFSVIKCCDFLIRSSFRQLKTKVTVAPATNKIRTVIKTQQSEQNLMVNKTFCDDHQQSAGSKGSRDMFDRETCSD